MVRDKLTAQDLARIEKIADRLAVALNDEPPPLAMYALEMVSSFVICNAKDYQSALQAQVFFHASISEYVSKHYGQDGVNQNVN